MIVDVPATASVISSIAALVLATVAWRKSGSQIKAIDVERDVSRSAAISEAEQHLRGDMNVMIDKLTKRLDKAEEKLVECERKGVSDAIKMGDMDTQIKMLTAEVTVLRSQLQPFSGEN